MQKKTRIGVALIIIGLFIPSILYPFAHKTRSAVLMQIAIGAKGGSYSPSLDELEIVIEKGKWIFDKGIEGHYENRIAIQYHLVLAFGIIIFFVGASVVALSSGWRQSI